MLQEQMLSFAMLGAEWVLYLLVLLSIVCIGIAVERVVYGALNTTPRGELVQAMTAYDQDGDAGELARRLGQLKGIEARVIGAGAEAGDLGGADSAEEALAGAMVYEKMKLERGLNDLWTRGGLQYAQPFR